LEKTTTQSHPTYDRKPMDGKKNLEIADCPRVEYSVGDKVVTKDIKTGHWARAIVEKIEAGKGRRKNSLFLNSNGVQYYRHRNWVKIDTGVEKVCEEPCEVDHDVDYLQEITYIIDDKTMRGIDQDLEKATHPKVDYSVGDRVVVQDKESGQGDKLIDHQKKIEDMDVEQSEMENCQRLGKELDTTTLFSTDTTVLRDIDQDSEKAIRPRVDYSVGDRVIAFNNKTGHWDIKATIEKDESQKSDVIGNQMLLKQENGKLFYTTRSRVKLDNV